MRICVSFQQVTPQYAAMVANVSTRLQQNHHREHKYIKSRFQTHFHLTVLLIWGRVLSSKHHLTDLSKTLGFVPSDFSPFGFRGSLHHDL